MAARLDHIGRLLPFLRGLVLLAAGLLRAEATPPELVPFTAEYRLEVNGIEVGLTRVSLERVDDGIWLYRNDSEGRGPLAWFGDNSQRESSRFEVTEEGLRPLEYRLERHTLGRDRSAHLSFDWDHNKVTNRVAGSTWTMTIARGTLDKLLVRLAVSIDLAQGHKEMSYPIADGGKLKTYRFAVEEPQAMRVPAGRYETLRLRRLREDNDRETLIWCSPELDYLPVRIRQDEFEDGIIYETALLKSHLGAIPAREQTDPD